MLLVSIVSLIAIFLSVVAIYITRAVVKDHDALRARLNDYYLSKQEFEERINQVYLTDAERKSLGMTTFEAIKKEVVSNATQATIQRLAIEMYESRKAEDLATIKALKTKKPELVESCGDKDNDHTWAAMVYEKPRRKKNQNNVYISDADDGYKGYIRVCIDCPHRQARTKSTSSGAYYWTDD